MFTWLNGSATQAPALLSLRSSKVFIISSVAAAVFTDLFLYGVIVPVIPFALTERANIPADAVQYWTSVLLAVYGAALLVGAPICGWYADRTSGRRWPLLLGLVALAGATAILTAGNSIPVLVVGRVLQGFSAAVVWVAGLALVADTVGKEGVGEAMGYVGIAMSFGVLLSPLVGGLVFERAGYYATFIVSFALLGVDIVLRLALIERRHAVKWIKVDGAAEESEKTSELDSSQTPPTTTASQTSVDNKVPAMQDQAESASPEPTPPYTSRVPTMIRLLGSRRLLCACLGCMVQSILLTSFDSTLPIFVRNTFDWNSLGAGLIFLPLAIPAFTAPVIGWLSDKYGPRYFATLGFVGIAPFVILQRLITSNTINQKVLLCALLALTGVCLDLALVPLMAEITYSMEATALKKPAGFLGDKGAIAQAYALFNIAFAAGSMIGPLVGGLVAQSKGWSTSTLVLGILSGIWALPTWYYTGGSWMRQRRRMSRTATTADETQSEV